MKKRGHSALLAFVVAASCATSAMAQPARPNILVVLLDDAGFTDIGAYGGVTQTPVIDGLARSGAKLSRYHTSPFCGPSRAMLLTGMDNHQVGMGTLVEVANAEMRALPSYSMRFAPDQKTIATLLSGAGYRTYVAGKWGIGEVGKNLPNRFGFDRSYVMDATGGSNFDMTPYLPGYDKVDWFEDGKPIILPKDFYSSRSLVDKMIKYVDEGDPERPFFALLSLQALHIPVQAPTADIDAYNGAFDAGWDKMRADRLQQSIAAGVVPPTTKLAPVPATHRVWADLTPAQRARAAREMQVNAGMMTAADYHIGRLLAHLKKRGQLDNTIVIVTSDNGAEAAMTEFTGLTGLIVNAITRIDGFDTSKENLGQPGSLTAIGPEWASVSSAPLNLYKFYSSEGGLRVPLVIAGPGIAASGIVDAPVHVADLVPTLLEAAGVPYAAESFYGRSAMPVLSGQAKAFRGDDEDFAFEVSGNAATYRGKWKITRLAPPLGDSKWRLYDLSVDPGETQDLSAANPELFEEMLAAHEAYAKKVGVFELAPGDSAFAQLSRNLAVKSLHKYWPYLLGFFMALLATLYVGYRLLRTLFRRVVA